MVEPSRSDPVKHLSNFVRVVFPFDGRRRELRLSCLPFAEILQALPGQSSLEIEQIRSTILQDWVGFHSWAGLAHRRDRDLGPCLASHEKLIKAHRPAGTSYRCNTEFPLVLRCTSS
jgi:hypothetical protein